MGIFDIFVKFQRELIGGLLVTLKLCCLVYPIGFSLGILLGVGRYRNKFFIGYISKVFSLILSSTPILVFLFWLHYPLQYTLDVVIDPFITSVFALSFLMIFIVSEFVSESLNNFPNDLILSAKVCGLSNRTIAIKVQMPIIFRQLLPNFIFTLVTILQSTLFTSLISVEEIFKVAQQINADIYKPVEIYTTLAIFFIIVCATLNIVAYWIKSKFMWKLSDL